MGKEIVKRKVKTRKNLDGNTSLGLVATRMFVSKAGRGDTKRIAELRRIATLYVRNFRILQNLETEKEGMMVRSAMNFAFILDGAAEKSGIRTETFKSFDGAVDFLRNKSGFRAVKEWIVKNASKQDIAVLFQGKSNNDAFTGLWNFHFSQIEEISNFERLKQVVFDFKAWFAFIVSTEKNMTPAEKMNWYGTNAPFNMWNKEKIFLSLIIAMTLESKPRPYTMEEIFSFIEKIGNFEEWVAELERKFMSVIEDDGVAELMWKHSAMNGAIEFLKKPQNRSMAKLIEERNVTLEHYQKIIYESFTEQLKRTLRIVTEYQKNQYQRLEDKVYLSYNRETMTKRFNEGISIHNPLSFTKAIHKAPSLISFLDEKNLFRLYVGSVGEHAPLREEIKRVCDPEVVARIIDNVSENITAERMLQMVWGMKDMNNLKIDIYFDEDQTRWAPGINRNTTGEETVYKQIISKFRVTIGMAPLDQLLKILIELEKIDVRIANDLVGIDDYMALIFCFKRKQIPKYIIQRVVSQKWYKLISKINDAKYYSELIQRNLLKEIEDSHLQGPEIPILKDTIRKYSVYPL